MLFDEIMQGIDYEAVQTGNAGGIKAEIKSIVTDSRKIAEGSLFVCLRGLKADGHKFIEEISQNGAVAVVIDRDQAIYPPGLSILKVHDARKSLAAISANFYSRPADKLRLFGVTGTNGKTSVTYMMNSILSKLNKTGLIGTIGLIFGGKPLDIPFSTSTTPDPPELMQILSHMANNGGRDVVMEVSSHALALHKMETLFFEAAMYTNLTQDHLDFHGTMENYMEAKAKLFTQCRFGIMNADDKYTPKIMKIGTPEKWITYGIDCDDCDIRAVNITNENEGSSFDITIGNKIENFYLPMKGRYNVHNALAVIGAALAVGITVDDIRAGLADFEGVPGRIQSIPNNRGFNVLVDYAHTPDGLVNIINAVRGFTEGKVITLFGCGGERDTEKRPIMGRVAGELSDYCIITSDNPRSEPPEKIIKQIESGVKDTNCPYDCITDRRSAIYHGISMLEAGDALIIAGKGHENYQLIGGQSLHFDDAEVAKDALNA